MNKIESKLIRKLIRGESLNLFQSAYLSRRNPFCLNPFRKTKYLIAGNNRFLEKNGRTNGNLERVSNFQENLVAKLRGSLNKSALNHEHKMYSLGKRQKLNVPESKGVFNVYNVKLRRFEKALIMEEIKGNTLYDLEFDQKGILTRVEKMAKKANKKANNLGFETRDGYGKNDGNVLFDPGNSKIYLIDSEYWRHIKLKTA